MMKMLVYELIKKLSYHISILKNKKSEEIEKYTTNKNAYFRSPSTSTMHVSWGIATPDWE